MDQDKVARIYSDLRKESMVSHLHLFEENPQDACKLGLCQMVQKEKKK